MNTEKKLITSKVSFAFCKKHMTKRDFYNKFELSKNLMITLCAENMYDIVANTDRAMSLEEVKTLKLNF